MTTNGKLYASIANSDFRARIFAAAAQIDFDSQSVESNELLDHPDVAHADCLVLQFETFDDEAAALIDDCRRRSPHAVLLAALKPEAMGEAGRFTRFGIFECLSFSSTQEAVYSALESAQIRAREIRERQAAVAGESWRKHLVGASTAIDRVTRIIHLVAARRCTVLITGETGTGKEMAARAIHLASDRSRKPLVSVNCSAIPENLIEAELFGHVKGAFTGAINARVGRFEQASGGTLFLDEIGDLPFDLQAKLLRVLQEREIQRLGSSETVKIDVRIIAATNTDLLARVRDGRFREDLFYRLNVVPIHMPALRERSTDVPLLVQHFVTKICSAEGMPAKEISQEVFDSLSCYAWPGNVRQLENTVEHAVIMSGERQRLYPSDFALPRGARPEAVSSITRMPVSRVPDEGLDYAEVLRQFESALLQQALSKAQGNKTLAADMLRLPRTTLLHKLRVLQPAVA